MDKFYKPQIDNELENILLQMCIKYFGELPPYSRKLSDTTLKDIKIELKKGHIYVAQNNNEIIGFCNLCFPYLDPRMEKYADDQKCDLYIAGLIITETFQKKGYGEKLLKFSLKEENSKGKLGLITPLENKVAIALYKKIGMHIVTQFDQTEINFKTNQEFNSPRIVMIGDISDIISL